MKKIVLVLSIIGLIINFIEAKSYNLKWGIGLRNFDIDTILGIVILSVIFYLILLVFRSENRITTAIILGSVYGFYKAINLYNLSGGAFGRVSLFTANHTITITLTILIIVSFIGVKTRIKEKIENVEDIEGDE